MADALAYTQGISAGDHMEAFLRSGHLAPTCPDTLRCYSFAQRDPFIIDDSPHVLLAGN